jgi:heptosyltransferase-3
MPDTGKKPDRILLVRNDRIGDLVLTIPAVIALREALPGARIDLLSSSYNAPILKGNPWLDDIITDKGAHDYWDLDELVLRIKERKYDCAVVMVSSFKNARLVRRAGIPLRIGPLVRWYAPFYFNKAIRQRRSRGEKSEAEYNIDLMTPLGIRGEKTAPPVIFPDVESVSLARDFISGEFGRGSDGPLVIVHPGMGGSALNWPEDFWRELVRLLGNSRRCVTLVTGSDTERDLLERVSAGRDQGTTIRIKTGLSLSDFIGLLSLASVVVAPSTGPLHLAAALGVPVTGIYSPVRAHHPRRWGPLGKGRKKIFLPPVDCPGKLSCLGEKCPFYYCMELVKPEQVFENILSCLDGC